MTLAPDEIRRILAAVDGSCWAEVSVTVGDTTLFVSTVAGAPDATPSATAGHQVSSAPFASSHVVESPSVGIFRSRESDGGPAAAPGDLVEVGTALGAVAVMKTTMPVTSVVAGVVAAAHVENGEPVEYGKALFTIDATAV